MYCVFFYYVSAYKRKQAISIKALLSKNVIFNWNSIVPKKKVQYQLLWCFQFDSRYYNIN